MDISIFGLGYVGSVSAACLANDGHNVIGVDTNPTKVTLINEGSSPIVEPGLPELISTARHQQRLRATTSCEEAIFSTTLSFLCIGTPSAPNGSLDLQYVIRVCEEIGHALRGIGRRHTVVVRSTMLPGTMEDVVIPTLCQASGLRANDDFGIAYHPEFLREGSAISDYQLPPKTVVGTSADDVRAKLSSLYSHIDAPFIGCDIRTAELVKYADNIFHALKVAFANEMGAVSAATHVDSHKLMEIFCQDQKLNLSPTYLKPGFAFGGSCLPKDLRALAHLTRRLDLASPMIDSILVSNNEHKNRAYSLLASLGKKRVGFLGLSFKDGTDDLRESPTVELVERLLGKGYSISIFDPSVAIAKLMGANKEYINREIPHIASLLVRDVQTLIQGSDIVVVTRRSKEYATVETLIEPRHEVVDLVRFYPNGEHIFGDRYHALVG